ncbi:unnamed protein product [Parajaminaea phylloscopi]
MVSGASSSHHADVTSTTKRTPISERPRTPSKRKQIQADRYIPMRDTSDAQLTAFQLMDDQPSSPSRPKRKVAPETDANKEEADGTFSALLSTEIFGPEASQPNASSSGSASGASSSRPSLTAPSTPTKRNLFAYSSPSSSRSRSVGGSGDSGRRGYSDDTTLRPGLVGNGSTPQREGRAESGSGGSRSLFGGKKKGGSNDSSRSPSQRAYDTSPVRFESQRMLLSPRRTPRVVSKVPFKVLDAPDLADDFYLNLVDWSVNNTLGVGLGKCVYLWSAKDSNVSKLVDFEGADDKVTSLSWAGRGSHIAVGTQKGLVQIWDAEQLKLLRTMHGHSMRVGSLAWNEHVLTSGSRDRVIYHRDVRAPEQYVRELRGHKQEVCGLKWNTETNQLASGGNDNKLFIWDSLNATPLHRFNVHTAAVKAIAWSPHQRGILASGGGTADMKIRYWNTITGTMLSELDTGSQVCNLVWSRTANEVISTHGYSAGKIQNQIQIWRYPTMQQVATLTGHTLRVLYLAMSPDGETIVTGAGDETLRFWDLNVSSGKKAQRDRIVQSDVLSPFAKLR